MIIILCFLAAMPTGRADAPRRVVASTSLVGDVVARVGGGRVEVNVLIPAQVDPHGFDPSPREAALVSGADLIFLNGAGLESFLEPFLRSVAAGVRTVPVSRTVDLRSIAAEEEEHGHPDKHVDPHVWFDPANVKRWVKVIEEDLSALDPEGAPEYRERAAAYRAELDALDQWIRSEVESIPPANRELISDHQMFGYFAGRYGFRQSACILPSVSTLAQPSARHVSALQRMLDGGTHPVILVGIGSNPDLVRRLSEDTGARVLALYTCYLSRPEGPAGTYLDFMRYNVSAIVEALKPAASMEEASLP